MNKTSLVSWLSVIFAALGSGQALAGDGEAPPTEYVGAQTVWMKALDTPDVNTVAVMLADEFERPIELVLRGRSGVASGPYKFTVSLNRERMSVGEPRLVALVSALAKIEEKLAKTDWRREKVRLLAQFLSGDASVRNRDVADIMTGQQSGMWLRIMEIEKREREATKKGGPR